MATVVGVVAAVVGVGLGIYSAVAGSGGVDMPPPPPPANAVTYDEDGNVTGKQIWDAASHSYIYKPGELSPEQKKDKAQRQKLRAQALQNLEQTPEDRQKRYDEFATAFSESMHKGVDDQYEKSLRAASQEMERRGLTGSDAHKEALVDLAGKKVEADTEIGRQATMAKESLANNDRQFDLSMLAQLDAGQKTDYVLGLEKQKGIADLAQKGTGSLMANYAATQNKALLDMQTKEREAAAWGNLGNNLSNTAGGLAYLYGYKSGGSSLTTGNPPAESRFKDSFLKRASSYSLS